MKKRVGLYMIAALMACAPFLNGATAQAAAQLGALTPYSAPDVTNPQRGQYENLMSGLFPQVNPAQSAYPAWPATSDTGNRYEWKQLQSVDPSTLPVGATDAQKYDFSVIDNDIATAAAQGKRFHFRVMAFSSCCATSYPDDTNISVPAWLRGLGGATNDYLNAGVTHVIPDWNNNIYLTNTEELIAALGRRYNKDERVSWFEMSGYGDFSENHNSFMRDTLGLPGPDGPNSIAQLGYYSQYEDQYITMASLQRLVNATLAAFPDTQILISPGNPGITKQLLRDNPNLANIQKPVGLRADCLAVYEPPQTWAVNQWSYYVQNNDPIIPVIHDRWKTAPIATEWCNWVPTTEQDYFDKALTDTVNYHVSNIASTGHPYQWSGTQMPLNLYNQWARTAKYSGYRYAMTTATVPDSISYGAAVPISVQWTNFGVAPTYNAWQVQYEIRDASNVVVRTVNSSLDLKTLYAEQNYTNVAADPASESTTDSLSLSTTGLPAGEYTIFAKAAWNDHKEGGTNPVTFANMNFAQAGRNNNAYPVGAFSLAAAPVNGGGGSTTSSSVSSTPGAPSTGAPRSTTPTAVYITIGAVAGLVLLSLGAVVYRRFRAIR